MAGETPVVADGRAWMPFAFGNLAVCLLLLGLGLLYARAALRVLLGRPSRIARVFGLAYCMAAATGNFALADMFALLGLGDAGLLAPDKGSAYMTPLFLVAFGAWILAGIEVALRGLTDAPAPHR